MTGLLGKSKPLNLLVWKDWGVSALLGALLALTSLPYAWSALFVLPLGALLRWVAHSSRPRTAFSRMFWAGSAYFAGHLLWLPLSFWTLFGPAALSFTLLWLLEGLFLGLLAAGVAWLCSNPTRRVWLLALLWPLLEWLRSLGPFAFPWGTVGYTLMPTPLAQTAELGGVYLLSLLVTLGAAGIAHAFERDYRLLGASAALWGLAALYGVYGSPLTGLWVREVGSGQALLVQGNLDARAKAAGLTQPFEIYTRLSSAARPGEVVIWPEAALSARQTPLENPAVAARLPAQAIFGYGALTASGEPANRALSWDGSERSSRDKAVLVPFGEFFPLQKELPGMWSSIFRAFRFKRDLRSVTRERSDAVLSLAGARFGTYICYESVFPSIARAAVREGAQVLVNLSNDGWFGVGQGIDQHFEMGRLRAIETRRYLLRAGNVGVTAVVNARGETEGSLPRFQEGTLRASYRLLEGETPYVRLGDWPLWLCVLLTVGIGMARKRRTTDTKLP